MNRKIAVVAICLLILIVMLPGCDTGKPSATDVEQAVLRAATLDYNYQWVKGVEIIKYGNPWKGNMYEFWPVRVYLVGDQQREEQDLLLYKDVFGEWQAIL